ncbi:MAG: insulinase family protein [Kofleriaceae bacterium]|nr:insulinase family protein [Kofleriaceae bacterium]
MRALSIAGLLLCGCLAAPRVPASPPRQANLGLAISSYLLANGLRVVLVNDPDAPAVQVTMRYQVGSVDDPADHPGMAHLVEHLMYEQVLDGESLLARFEDVATFYNATTTHDATTYVARASGEHLEDLLSLEAARVQLRCGSITDSTFAREREVVVNELTLRDQATEILGSIAQALYPVGHPYRRNVGGTVDSVAAITRDQACAFADAHYAPNNAVLVVSGKITPAQEKTIFGKYVAQVPKRAVVAPVPIYQVPFQPWFVSAPVEIDDDALLVAWPVPSDARLRAKIRAFVVAMATLIDNEIAGSVTPIDLGDTRSPMVGLVIFPAANETFQHARDGMERGVARLAGGLDQTDEASFGELAFDRIQQSAIYQLYAALEDGGDRDTRLASYTLAGGDPRTVFQDEIAGLRDMDAYEAAALARTYLTLQSAKVVVLDATEGKKRGSKVALTAAIHDLGQRRRTPDVAEAHHAASAVAQHAVAMKTRTLPNGLRVVLLPSTSVPTVEMRLVFGVGTADEPADKRGVAQVAASSLSWDMRYLKDLMLFAAVGGTKLVDVGLDRTTFAAHGVDMNLDFLLAGLRRWVREGTYDESVDDAVDAQRRQRKKLDDDGPFTDAWRTAVFGASHPYAHAGLARHGSKTLTVDDAARFRAAYYTPDNATLVIAGQFDAELADRWIDYLFADWTGHAHRRSSPRSTLAPASIAKLEDLGQVQLRVAMPAKSSSRAAQLVAAEMLSEIAGDVRHQLGATYDLSAQLAEQRLSLNYFIAGSIDASRASSALELLRDRIHALQSDKDVAARAFVLARSRVMTRLTSVTGSAALLAQQVERDIEMGRAPMTDLGTAADVGKLTIDQMSAALAELSLDGAVVAMRGPATDVTSAFAVLGRKPAPIAVATSVDSPDDVSAPGTRTTRSESPTELADPITMPRRDTGRVIGLQLGIMTSGLLIDRPEETQATGFDLAIRFGGRLRGGGQAGFHAGIGLLTVPEALADAMLVPIDLLGYYRYGRDGGLSATVMAGLHYQRLSLPAEGTTETESALGLGAELAYDFARLEKSWCGIFVRAAAEVGSSTVSTFSVGGTFHR